jgi:hypothetical protein
MGVGSPILADDIPPDSRPGRVLERGAEAMTDRQAAAYIDAA